MIGSDLYEGLSGVVLFLGYLYSSTGDNRFKDLAEAGASTLWQRISAGDLSDRGGAFNGLSGSAYAFSHLGSSLDEPLWIERAVELSARISELVLEDLNLDLMTGVSGALLALLTVKGVSRDRDVAKGVELLSNRLQIALSSDAPALPYLRGASHGYSGAVLALATATNLTHDSREALTKIAARELDLTTNNAWIDPADNLHIGQATWCHGAPGIGLCRTAAANVGWKPLREGARSAFGASRGTPMPQTLGLCHGLAGLLEIELAAQQVLENVGTKHLAHLSSRLCAGVAEELAVQSTIKDIGLMTGLSGIGLQLLRFTNPLTPSVLVLAPPSGVDQNRSSINV